MQTRVALVGGNDLSDGLGRGYRGLVRQGYPTMHLGDRRLCELLGLAQAHKDILAALTAYKPDIIIHWQSPHSGAEEFVRECRKLAPTVYWTVDDPHRLLNGWTAWQHYDAVWTCCAESVAEYVAKGKPAVLVYPTIDRAVDCPLPGAGPPRWDVGMACTNLYHGPDYKGVMASRVEILRVVSRLGRVAVMGLSPRAVQLLPTGISAFARIPHEHQRFFFADCKINLNSHVEIAHRGYLNERCVEILATGGFMLCDAVAGIEDIFVDGKHLALYHNLQELRQKVEHYLEADAERVDIGEAGRALVAEKFDAEKVMPQAVADTLALVAGGQAVP